MATVLVIDERAVNRDLVRTVLGYRGHRVLEADDPATGLQVVREQFPDVVVTDVLTGGMGGYELVRELREGRATRSIPVIFYTADVLMEETRPIATACGVHAVVSKTGDLSALTGAVESALGEPAAPARPADLDELQLRTLRATLVDKAHEAERRRRGSELAAAAVEVTEDLTTAATRQRIVAAARALVSAHWAGLAVLDEDGGPEWAAGDGVLIAGRPGAEFETPIEVAGRPYGLLRLVRRADGTAFDDTDRTLIAQLARAAGVALGNARRYEQARRREAWLSASAGIVSALLAGQQEDALELVLRGARDITGADVAWIELVDQDDVVSVAAVDGQGADRIRGAAAPTSDAVLMRSVAESRSPVRLRDSGAEATGLARRLAGLLELGPLVAIPLRGPGRFLGALLVANARGGPDFARADVDTCTTFAANTALVLEFARAEDDRQRLRVVEERDRIARDLHDVVIQRLFALGLTLDRTARRAPEPLPDQLHAVTSELDEIITQIRTTIFSLRAGGALARGLRHEVVKVVEDAGRVLGFAPRLRMHGALDTAVPETLHHDLLATLREALSNAAKHSGASMVDVLLRATDGRLALDVVDDGRGLGATSRRSGLANLRHRAAAHGGALTLAAGPDGRGLALQWEVPLGG